MPTTSKGWIIFNVLKLQLVSLHHNVDRFMDFDLKKLKVDSHADVGPVFVGPGIKDLLEGNNCNPAGAALDTCNINQFEVDSRKTTRMQKRRGCDRCDRYG